MVVGAVRGAAGRVRGALRAVTVEPLMLLDGLAFSNMHVFIENLQMERMCQVQLELPTQVCANLTAAPEASVQVQKHYSVFAFYNSIIAAALPLFFILFMGAWSDKYGRKVPLLAVQLGHVLHAGGYLLASMAPQWPPIALLALTLLDTLGGGMVSFLTAANAYIGDVTSAEQRTSRVGLANSVWFLGGPAGTLLGVYLYDWGGYRLLFATSLTLSLLAVLYVALWLPESHGPFATVHSAGTDRKAALALRRSVAAVYGLEVDAAGTAGAGAARPSLATMVKDFFNPQRIVDSCRATFKSRPGNARGLLLLLILTCLLRRLTRSPYVFAWSRHVLGWEATDYSLWVTYKNLLATTGSLVAVPLLSGRLGVSDLLLALVGTSSGILEYATYSLVVPARAFLFWLGPLAAVLLNSCTIAQRSMMTKLVGSDEIGKVSAVMGALDGTMPMVTSALYTLIYHASVSVFPAAHFLVGVVVGGLMILLFCVLAASDRTQQYDVEGATLPPRPRGPVHSKSLATRTNSWWAASESLSAAVPPHLMLASHEQEGLHKPLQLAPPLSHKHLTPPVLLTQPVHLKHLQLAQTPMQAQQQQEQPRPEEQRKHSEEHKHPVEKQSVEHQQPEEHEQHQQPEELQPQEPAEQQHQPEEQLPKEQVEQQLSQEQLQTIQEEQERNTEMTENKQTQKQQ